SASTDPCAASRRSGNAGSPAFAGDGGEVLSLPLIARQGSLHRPRHPVSSRSRVALLIAGLNRCSSRQLLAEFGWAPTAKRGATLPSLYNRNMFCNVARRCSVEARIVRDLDLPPEWAEAQ